MGRLTWSVEAERWPHDIFRYIAEDNPDAAGATVSGIVHRAATLMQFPRAGYRYQRSNRDVRILLYGHYRIANLINPDDDIVVLGIFHGALDIDRYLV